LQEWSEIPPGCDFPHFLNFRNPTTKDFPQRRLPPNSFYYYKSPTTPMQLKWMRADPPPWSRAPSLENSCRWSSPRWKGGQAFNVSSAGWPESKNPLSRPFFVAGEKSKPNTLIQPPAAPAKLSSWICSKPEALSRYSENPFFCWVCRIKVNQSPGKRKSRKDDQKNFSPLFDHHHRGIAKMRRPASFQEVCFFLGVFWRRGGCRTTVNDFPANNNASGGHSLPAHRVPGENAAGQGPQQRRKKQE